MEKILQIDNLKKYYSKRNFFGRQLSLVKAVDDVSFSIERGQTLVLAGESGSGKSTIAKLILHSIIPDSGRIIFDGVEISNNPDLLEKIRAEIQMVYQDPYDSINPQMKIHQIISEPLEIYKIGNSLQRREIVQDVLKQVKLEPANDIMEKYPH
ncbi:MAG: ATP-binding cassette domain-containing protein, partial [Candidatus Nitrosotenuis sp.]